MVKPNKNIFIEWSVLHQENMSLLLYHLLHVWSQCNKINIVCATSYFYQMKDLIKFILFK